MCHLAECKTLGPTDPCFRKVCAVLSGGCERENVNFTPSGSVMCWNQNTKCLFLNLLFGSFVKNRRLARVCLQIALLPGAAISQIMDMVIGVVKPVRLLLQCPQLQLAYTLCS